MPGVVVTGTGKGVVMIAAAELNGLLDAHCPLCGALVLTLDDDGRVEADSLMPVPLRGALDSGEAYGICEQCAYLAHLSSGLTLN
jgi:hypothetical protein